MRLAIVSPDASGNIEGTIKHQLLDRLPNVVSDTEEADCVLVPVSFYPEIQVNPKLYHIKKPTVLVDFMEYGSSWDGQDTHIFGKNHEVAGCLQTPGWIHFSEWVKNNPPVLTFKRELIYKDYGSTIKPISFLCDLPRVPLHSKEQYEARALDIAYIWGYSHESRPRLHADIFRGMTTNGLGVITDWSHFYPHLANNPPKSTWAACYVPWYARKPMHDVLWMYEQAKIGVSCYGHGLSCFRTSELRSTVMAMPMDGLAFPYQWIHEENCLKFRNGHEFEDLETFTHRDDLYEIYLAGQENLDKYRPDRFIPEYFLPTIQAAL